MPKILSLIFLALPSLFTILGFSFALVSTLHKDWAHYDQLSTPSGADLSLPAKQTVEYRIHRGLLVKCSVGTSDVNNGTGIIPSCTRFPITGGLTSCDVSTGGNLHLCQLIHLATGLMVASVVLLGLSLILTLVLFGLSYTTISLRGAFLLPSSKPSSSTTKAKSTSKHTRHPKPNPAASSNTVSAPAIPTLQIINLPNTMFLLASSICGLFGQIIGLHALTDEQRSAGDWIVTGTDPADITPWVMGSGGLGFGTASWVCAGVAGLVGLCVWGVPKVGWVSEVDDGSGSRGTGVVERMNGRMDVEEGGKGMDREEGAIRTVDRDNEYETRR